VSGSGNEGATKKFSLDLAKPLPIKEQRQKREEQLMAMKPKLPGDDKLQGLDEKAIDETGEVTPKFVVAVKEVAESLGGDVQKTESELLQKLKEHAVQTQNGKAGKALLNDMFVGMKIDRTKQGTDVGNYAQQQLQKLTREDSRSDRTVASVERRPSHRAVLEQATKRTRVPVNLFGSGSLKIFTGKTEEVRKQLPEFPKLDTWDKLEKHNLQLLVTHPPENGFEEMILWTKENKLWKFPIDNEQGLEEEAKVGFHEHIFLDHLLQDGFPKKGPVRHFMELVTTGLSKNPYMTVNEKHDHVAWFREYFKSKSDVLKEIGAYDL